MMERFWSGLAVALGKRWKLVAGALAAIVAVLVAVGVPRLDFATGEESYLNQDSQIAIDNELFQHRFGGETIVMLFTAEDGYSIEDLFSRDNGNYERLDQLRDDLNAIDEAVDADAEGDDGEALIHAVVDPLTTLEFSHALLAGEVPLETIAGQALLTALLAEEDGSAERMVRQTDGAKSVARFDAIVNCGGDGRREIGYPDHTELLIFDNQAFDLTREINDLTDTLSTTCEDLIRPDDPADRQIRAALRGTFPEHDGHVQRHVMGGVVLKGNASLDEMSDATVAVLDVIEAAEFEGFELMAAGSPIYLKEINDYLQGGMLTLGAAALIVMAVVLAVMFRVRWRLLPLVACIIGIVCAFSLLGVIGLPLSLVTISGLPILIGLGIDFAIQIHNRVEEEVTLDHAAHPIVRTLTNVAPALVVATIAAVVAFISLRVSLVPMIRDFGVLLAIGVAVMFVIGVVVATSALGIREYKQRTAERKVSVVERITVKLGSLPEKLGGAFVVGAVAIFAIGVVVEGGIKIESDPLRWVDQDSETVQNVRHLEAETGTSTTMGVLVQANNLADQDVIDVMHRFILEAEARDEVVAVTALVSTFAKVIAIPGASALAPTTADLVRGVDVLSPPLRALLFDFADGSDGEPAVADAVVVGDAELPLPGVIEATQINMRLGPASLEQRAVLVAELQADLDRLIAEAEIDPDSILLQGLDDGEAAMRATPSGLAVVGVGLLENIGANRAGLTYLALAVVALWLLVRFRSLGRMFFTLVPVGIAVGLSAIVVGGTGITMSPMTVVSGPLVIATCAEFSVLITARYLEERQRGLDPGAASDRASGRTGRAFFTSAATTVGGFAVLIGSALPLLRDFGIIVTLNVTIALLAALVVMPPLVKWADSRGWMGAHDRDDPTAPLRLAAPATRGQLQAAAVGLVVIVGAGAWTLASLDTTSGEAASLPYRPVPLAAPAPPEEVEEPEEPDAAEDPADPELPIDTDVAGEVDPADFDDELPSELAEAELAPIVQLTLVANGVEPNVATCVNVTLYENHPDADVLVAFLDAWGDGIPQIVEAMQACGIDDETVDDVLAAGVPQ